MRLFDVQLLCRLCVARGRRCGRMNAPTSRLREEPYSCRQLRGRPASQIVRAVLAMGLLVLAPVASASTITVNSTADAVDGNDGECTLREAIQAANNNTASGPAAGECAAGEASPTVDTVAFAIPGAGDRKSTRLNSSHLG